MGGSGAGLTIEIIKLLMGHLISDYCVITANLFINIRTRSLAGGSLDKNTARDEKPVTVSSLGQIPLFCRLFVEYK